MSPENDRSLSENQANKLDKREAAQLLAEAEEVSVLLNAATSLNEIVRAIALPGINSGATSAALFIFEFDHAGQPEWLQLRATWTREKRAVQTVGMRFYLPDFPPAKLWLNDPANPLFIDDTTQDQRIDAASRDSFLQAGTVAMALLPLPLRGRWVGLVIINWDAPHLFTAGDRRLYSTLASQAAVVVDNRLLLEQTQKRTAQLEKVTEIGAALSRARNETEIIAAVALAGDITRDVNISLSYLEVDEAGKPVAAREVARWHNGFAESSVSSLGETTRLTELPAASLWLNAPNSVLFIEDLLTDPRVNTNNWTNATQQDIRAMAIIPLHSSGRWQGAITFSWPKPRVFTTDERFILRQLLESAAAVVASRQAYLAEQETRNFLDSIIENIPVALFIKDAVDLRFVRWNKASEELFGFSEKDMLGKCDHDFFPKEEADFFVTKDREVLAGGRPADILEEPVETPHKGLRLLYTRKTPIVGIDGQPKYLLGISEDITDRRQVEEKLTKLAAELQTVAEVSTAASTTLDVPVLVQRVVDLTKERFGLYHAHIYLLAEDRSSLNLVAGAGETGRAMVAEGWSIPLEQERSLVARAARHRQGVIVNDVRQEPDWLPNPLLPDTRAEMAVPIIVGDQVLGVLDVQSDVMNRFMDEDVRIQTTLAGQIGVALRNARLYEQIQTALQETQQSQRLLQSVINATPDWIFIKDQEYRYRLVNQGYANALHLNPEDFIGKNDLELGFPEELVKGSPEKGIRGFWTDDRQVMDSGEPLVNPYDPATIDGEMHIFHTIKAPVRDAAGNVTGVLAFARDVTEREQILAETEAMYNASRRLSAAANLQEVTAAVAEGVRVPAINRAVLLAAEQNSAGEIEALAVIANWHSGSETSPIPVGAHYPRSILESVKLLLTPEPLFFDDVQNDQRINPAELDLLLQQRVRCLAVLPLRTGGRQLGVLLLQGEKPHHFTENESRSYPTLVGQMAIAVENQRLLEQARARVRYEQLLRETTARVHSATDITFVMRTAVREIGQLLGRPTYIYLAHQEQLQTDETLKEK